MAKYRFVGRTRFGRQVLGPVLAWGLMSGMARSAFAAEVDTDAKANLADPQLVSVPTERDSEARDSSPHGSAFVDPLGFAVFGPRLGAELGAGRFSFALHARWFNAGLLSHRLFLSDGDSFEFSYGGGVRGRYFLSDGLRGAHLGVAAEYLSTRIATAASLVRARSAYAVPYAEGGYRLPFGQFYADASAGIGYAFQLSSKVENLPGGSSAAAYGVSDKSSVYAAASLELGLYF